MSDGDSSNTALPVDTVEMLKQSYEETIVAIKNQFKEREKIFEERMKKYEEKIDALQKNREELLTKNAEMQLKLKFLEKQCDSCSSSSESPSIKYGNFFRQLLDFECDLSFNHSLPGVLVEALPLWRKFDPISLSESTFLNDAKIFFAEFCKILNCHLPDINFEAVPQTVASVDTGNSLGEKTVYLQIDAKDADGCLVNPPFTIVLKNEMIDDKNFEHQIFEYLNTQLDNNEPFHSFYGLLTNGIVFWLYCFDFSRRLVRRCKIK